MPLCACGDCIEGVSSRVMADVFNDIFGEVDRKAENTDEPLTVV